jgi:CRP/FNR family transcriptional regulator, cyclic AMP receptor protein
LNCSDRSASGRYALRGDTRGDFQRFRVGLFEGCTDAQIRRLGTIVQRVPYTDGEVICRQGKPALDFHVMLEGQAELSMNDMVVQQVGPGEFFGELAVLAGRTWHATATSVGESLVGAISAEAFEDVLIDVPAMSRKLLHSMAERIWGAMAIGVLKVEGTIEAGSAL